VVVESTVRLIGPTTGRAGASPAAGGGVSALVLAIGVVAARVFAGGEAVCCDADGAPGAGAVVVAGCGCSASLAESDG
jgi:hypothetical protein